MKKVRGFTLIELVFSIFILSLLVVSFLPAISSIDKSRNKLDEKETRLIQAQNAMEKAIAHQVDDQAGQVYVKISNYSPGLELVEVFDSETKDLLLYSLRKK